jgi:hypothetical protein
MSAQMLDVDNAEAIRFPVARKAVTVSLRKNITFFPLARMKKTATVK